MLCQKMAFVLYKSNFGYKLNKKNKKLTFFLGEYLEIKKETCIFAVPNTKVVCTREFSSAGSEHLPYKQRVSGSNPLTPTEASDFLGLFYWYFTDISTHFSKIGSSCCPQQFLNTILQLLYEYFSRKLRI